MAQQPDASAAQQAKQEKVAGLKQSLAQNQAALKSYSWTEATQISLKGEVKKQEQKQCQYGPDGKVQKTPIPGSKPTSEPKEESGGRGRRVGAVKVAVVEKKVGEMKDYMQQVAALIHQYVPPDPQKIQAAQVAGNVAAQPAAGGVVTLNIKTYLKDGDLLGLGFDSRLVVVFQSGLLAFRGNETTAQTHQRPHGALADQMHDWRHQLTESSFPATQSPNWQM